MPTPTIPKRYYPKLSEVISVDDLPEFLSFVEHGLEGLLDHIHYKNLQFSKSKNGDGAFYSLDIVSKKLSIPLPFGMALVLNPDEDTHISSFPVSFMSPQGLSKRTLRTLANPPRRIFHVSAGSLEEDPAHACKSTPPHFHVSTGSLEEGLAHACRSTPRIYSRKR